MRIHWDRIVASILLLTAFVLGMRYRHAISGFLGNMERIGPGHSADEQTLGLIALGLIGVCIVAVVKILTRDRDP